MSDELLDLVLDLGGTVGQCDEEEERIDMPFRDGEVNRHDEDDAPRPTYRAVFGAVALRRMFCRRVLGVGR